MERRMMAVALAMCSATLTATAQADDFGIWTEAGVEMKLSKRWNAEAEAEWRLRDNASETDRWSVGVQTSYKLTYWLKASAGYTLLYDNNHKLNGKGTKRADYWGERHRLNLSLTASRQWGGLTLALRERYQFTYRPEQTVMRHYVATGHEDDYHTYAAKSKHLWRNRLTGKYKLSKTWRPFASAESFVGAQGLDKMRYSLGTDIRIDKQNVVSLRYIFQNVYKDGDDEGNRHVLGIGYTRRF